jgi:hypothetical protein
MALEFKPIEIVLDGLDQKTAALMQVPGKLVRAVNVEYDKTGAINKRLGYQFVNLSNTVNLFDDDAVFCSVAVLRDELVVFSYDHVCSLGSRDSELRGADSLVYRGPCPRGAGRLQYVGTARISNEITGAP